MTAPLNKAIYDKIEARLANATVANGYSNEFKRVERGTLKPFKAHDLPAVNLWAANVGNEINRYNEHIRSIRLFVEVYSKTRDDPFMDVCDVLAYDLVTALNRAVLAPKVSDVESPILGGTVEKFLFTGYDYQIGEGQNPFCGILANFLIEFKTTPNSM